MASFSEKVLTKQIMFGAPIHTALNDFRPVNPTLDLAAAIGQRYSRYDSWLVGLQSLDEASQYGNVARVRMDQPVGEGIDLPLPKDRAELLGQCIRDSNI
jgi:hypothetical protein